MKFIFSISGFVGTAKKNLRFSDDCYTDFALPHNVQSRAKSPTEKVFIFISSLPAYVQFQHDSPSFWFKAQ